MGVGPGRCFCSSDHKPYQPRNSCLWKHLGRPGKVTGETAQQGTAAHRNGTPSSRTKYTSQKMIWVWAKVQVGGASLIVTSQWPTWGPLPPVPETLGFVGLEVFILKERTLPAGAYKKKFHLRFHAHRATAEESLFQQGWHWPETKGKALGCCHRAACRWHAWMASCQHWMVKGLTQQPRPQRHTALGDQSLGHANKPTTRCWWKVTKLQCWQYGRWRISVVAAKSVSLWGAALCTLECLPLCSSQKETSIGILEGLLSGQEGLPSRERRTALCTTHTPRDKRCIPPITGSAVEQMAPLGITPLDTTTCPQTMPLPEAAVSQNGQGSEETCWADPPWPAADRVLPRPLGHHPPAPTWAPCCPAPAPSLPPRVLIQTHTVNTVP